MERLEQIVEAMESDKMPLEDLIVRYEEGVKLVRICQEKLESAERRIEIIKKSATGKAQLAPFEPATIGAASTTEAKPEKKPAQDVSLF